MHRTIIALLTILFCTSRVYSQNKTFEDSLFSIESEIFYSTNLVDKSEMRAKKLTYLIKNDSIFTLAFNEIKKIDYNKLSDGTKSISLWNAALIAYVNKNFEYSWTYYQKYNSNCTDTSTQNLLLGYILACNINELMVTHYKEKLVEKDSLFLELDLQDLHEKQVKLKSFKILSSTILPGSGLIFNGNVLKGTLALGINTSVFFLIRYLLQNNLYINTFLIGTNLIGKYYFGNIRLTSAEITKKEVRLKRKRASKSALQLERILSLYPLNFKLII